MFKKLLLPLVGMLIALWLTFSSASISPLTPTLRTVPQSVVVTQ